MDACCGAEHPQPPAGPRAGGTGGSWARGRAVGPQEAMPGEPFLCGNHNGKQRALVTNGVLRAGLAPRA